VDTNLFYYFDNFWCTCQLYINCQQGSTNTDTDTRYNTDTVYSDAESLVSEEDSDVVISIIE